MRYVVLGSDGVPYEKFADGTSKDLSDEIPFDLPQGWMWARLGVFSFITKLAGFEYSKNIAKSLAISGIPLIKGKNIQGSNLIEVFEDFIPDEVSVSLSRSRITRKCLLLPYVGTIGNVAVFDKNYIAHLGSNVAKIEFDIGCGIEEEYVALILRSPTGYRLLTRDKKATAQDSLSMAALRNVLIPIPSSNEQQRIVAKVEELFALADQIDISSDRITKLLQLLNKKVLDLAIRGKLVPQDPNDEPASELVKRIETARNEKTGSKKSRAAASHKPTYEIEPPFDIPESWQWVRLGSISNYGECQTIDANKIPSKTWSLDLEEIEKGSGRLLVRRLAGEKASTSSKHKFCKGMILYSKLRTYLNKVLIADMDGVCTSEIIPITLLGDILPEYIRTVLMSPYFLAYTASKDYGVKMPRIGTGDARAALIPLPPLAEQKRIVKKIDELKKMTQALVAL